MSVGREEVLRMAELASLDLPDADVERLTAELSEILEYVAALSAARLEGVPEEPGDGAPLRNDLVAPDPLLRPLDAMAPEWRDGFFVLPRVGAREEPGAAERP